MRTREDQIEKLVDVMRNYRLLHTKEEDNEPVGYPLIDALTYDGGTVDIGVEELGELAAELYDSVIASFILEAEHRAEQRVRAEIARDIEKACESVMGIETPMMRGDNLAITICTHFEDREGEPDDNGWHPKAIEGHDQVKRGIEQHFLKAIDAAREVG